MGLIHSYRTALGLDDHSTTARGTLPRRVENDGRPYRVPRVDRRGAADRADGQPERDQPEDHERVTDPGPAEAIATHGLSPTQVTVLRELLVTMITAREGTTDDEAVRIRT